MAYAIREQQMGMQPIGAVSTTQQHPGGTLVRAYDPVYGDAEFVYLQGVASTVQGSVVSWSGVSSGNPTWQTALVANTANQAVPVAVASAAIGASQWGWYQVGGVSQVLSNGTFAAAGPMYIGAVGQVTSTAGAGKQIVNATGLTAVGTPSGNLILASLNRPFAQGAIT